MKRLYLLALLCISCVILQANNLDQIYVKWEKGDVINTELHDFLASHSIPLSSIQSEFSEINESKRLFYCYCINKEISFTKDVKVKEYDVYFLVNYGLTDSNSNVIYQSVKYLLSYPSSFFSSISVSKLSSIIMRETVPHKKLLIKLSGQVNCIDLIPYYKKQLIQSNIASDLWSIHLAMARMGEVEEIEYCLDLLKGAEVNNNSVFYLIPDLIYIQNKEVISYLFEQILKDDKNCTSTNPDNEVAINCAYRLMELVAPCVIDFPVELYPSGDIVSENYKHTLETVRTWILNNAQTFELN